MTNDEATRLANDLRAHWPQAELTAQEAESWVRTLTDLRFDIAVAAAERLIRESTWLPKIADFLATYRSLVPSVAGAERGRRGCRDCHHGWVEQPDGRVRPCGPCERGEPRQMRSGREIEPPLSAPAVRARIADLRAAVGRLPGAGLGAEQIEDVLRAAAVLWPGAKMSESTELGWRRGLRTVEASLVEDVMGAAFDESPAAVPDFRVLGRAHSRLVGLRAGGVLRTANRPLL